MKKEKHIVNKIYGNHQLARYIDVYEVSANRCHSVPESGYKGTEATLVDDPAWNERFSSYSITGATLTGNNFIINNDVTAKANYETAKNVTTIRCNSTKNSGFIGDTALLTNSSPAWNEKFSSYSITGSTLTGSNFKFTGSNITAQANFETAKNVTLQTDGHGTIASTKSSGFINDTATLSNTASNGYGFSGYSITGTTLTGSNFKFTGSNITAKAWFSASPRQYFIKGVFGPVDPEVWVRSTIYPIGNTFTIYRSDYGYNTTTARKALGLVITAWDNELTTAVMSQHSQFYKSVTFDGATCTGVGLNKEITISAIELYQSDPVTAYNTHDILFNTNSAASYSQWTQPAVTQSHVGWRRFGNMNFPVSTSFAIMLHGDEGVATDFTGYFSGYVTT